MKTIFALDVNSAKNEVLNSFMRLMVPHVVANEVINREFKPQVEELQKQSARFAAALENHRFSLLTEKVTQADSRRDKKWTAAKAVLVAEMESPDAAHKTAAETINRLFDSFGKIRNMGFAEQSGAMSSLCNDLIKNHLAELELTGLLTLIQDLKRANNEFVAAYEERTESLSEVILGETRDAKKALITAYRTLIFLLNARILQKGSAGLEEFINYANTLIRQYRPMVGQSPAPAPDESLDEGLEDEGLDGDLGDEDIDTPPTTEPQYSVAKFIFQSGESEEIRQLVGSVLNAPQNTENCRWIPEVPATMPAVNTTYNEVAEGEPLYTIAWYDKSTPVAWYELPAGAAVPEAPEPPAGHRWAQAFTVMPARDVDIIAVAL